jgi:hypothetical protein
VADTVFVVEQLRWADRRHTRPETTFWRRIPAVDAVATFPDRVAAEAECRRLEAASRKGADPFLLGGPALWYQTSLDSGRLNDWLLDHDVPVPKKPPADHKAWRRWWQTEHRKLSERQRADVWGALDKARFYGVTERPAVSVYAVVSVCWKVGVGPGKALPSDPEGGHLHGVYRTAEQAEAERAELDARLRHEERELLAHEPVNYTSFEVTRPGIRLAEATVEQAPFAETIEVPVWGEIGSDSYLLFRPAYDMGGGVCLNYNDDPTEGDVPLAMFGTREAAEAERARRVAEARQVVGPFAFAPPHFSLHRLTERSEEGLCRAVRACGLQYPTAKARSHEWGWPALWSDWWDQTVDQMSDGQRERVWNLLESLRFFDVTVEPVEG